ncbi:MAG: zinc ribbon domain-containing protein [Betaproteobacteria bacterium]|nr:zinc ribbon domain-containing protein [Betaproteobacteria bacterium]
MPIYDYKCSACNHTFELLVRASTVPACPACASTAVDKQLSLTAPPGKIPGLVRSARSQAAKEGHFSNYSAAERAKT